MIPELYPKIYLYRRIVQAKLFMDKFYFNHIYLDNIADEAYFSKFHFIRLFKKIYNKTPHQYLMYVRIEKARQLLQSNTTVSEVCFSIGFNSISSFTGLFKKTVGLTPSAYQNIQHQLKLDIARSPLKFIPNCFAVKNGWT
jgi:AraC-like DNA-binding protein